MRILSERAPPAWRPEPVGPCPPCRTGLTPRFSRRRSARVAFGKDEEYSFDVPMPGETVVAPAAKIRRFLGDNGLARLLGGAEASRGAVATPAAPRL